MTEWKRPTLGDALAATSIHGMAVSVTLANPHMVDCPLIGCSAGFTKITGYTREEIVGRNCRFLNEGCDISPVVRTKLRRSAISGAEFIGVLMNRRKDGTPFHNLLHMTRVRVGNQSFILGIQADVTGLDLDISDGSGHRVEMQRVVDKIFESNINAWVRIQGEVFTGLGAHSLEEQAPGEYAAAKQRFVALEPLAGDLCQVKQERQVYERNTFLELAGDAPQEGRHVTRSMSPVSRVDPDAEDEQEDLTYRRVPDVFREPMPRVDEVVTLKISDCFASLFAPPVDEKKPLRLSDMFGGDGGGTPEAGAKEEPKVLKISDFFAVMGSTEVSSKFAASPDPDDFKVTLSIADAIGGGGPAPAPAPAPAESGAPKTLSLASLFGSALA